ncbi:uncharacterized protein LOC115333103 [Ixodes scapularis]|uniref:uncharacterized protein LOC115333103 n=1 Tax=Ixodes scapularis TaxID=6945 RepID=UPI001C38D922|nr:uncharacterized protein LOC115333103 [Ixodes scapularis]
MRNLRYFMNKSILVEFSNYVTSRGRASIEGIPDSPDYRGEILPSSGDEAASVLGVVQTLALDYSARIFTIINMPRRFTGKLCRFLFNHLNRRTFGDLLEWVKKKEGRFRTVWKHGNGSNATVEDYVVFLEWDKFKKRGKGGTRARKPSRKLQCHDTTKKKNTSKKNTEGPDAKQRFRSALRKMKFEVESCADGFQVMRFPKSDLEYLLQKEQLPPSPNTSEGSDDTFAGSDDSSQLSPGHASLEQGNFSFPLDNKANVTPCFDSGRTNYDMDSTNITVLPGEVADTCGSSDDIFTSLLNSYQLDFLQKPPTPEPLMQETFRPLSELHSPELPQIPVFLSLPASDQISSEALLEVLCLL